MRRLTCEYDWIPCNDGDQTPHKHLRARWMENVAVQQIPSLFFFNKCSNKNLRLAWHFMNTENANNNTMRTKYKECSHSLKPELRISHSNYNNYYSLEMIENSGEFLIHSNKMLNLLWNRGKTKRNWGIRGIMKFRWCTISLNEKPCRPPLNHHVRYLC